MPTPKEIDKALFGPKIHPWRSCARGYYLDDKTEQVWKADGPNPIIKDLHLDRGIPKCVKNSGKKDQLHFVEMVVMAGNYFSNLKGPPSAATLGYPRGAEFDWLIRGWTKYWNEVFEPNSVIDPNLVKALIATESRFEPEAGRPKSGRKNTVAARGLMQLREQTRRILGNSHGELTDYLVIVSSEEIFDPIPNICAGVRWLFRKKELASARLKRSATWIEAVAEYKDYLRRNTTKAKEQMDKFRRYYQELQN